MVETDGVDSDDLTPTPSTIRQNSAPREDAKIETQALIRSVQMMAKGVVDMQAERLSQSRHWPVPRSTTHANAYAYGVEEQQQDLNGFTYGDNHPMAKEEQRAKDQKLLEMLGEIVKGLPFAAADHGVRPARQTPWAQPAALGSSPAALGGSGFQPSGSVSNSGGPPPPPNAFFRPTTSTMSHSFSPADVPEEEDPQVAELIEMCSEAFLEVANKVEDKRQMEARLLRELRQIQERSERQYYESSSLIQRVHGAKQQLAEKLSEASLAVKELRGHISQELHAIAVLRARGSEGARAGLQGLQAHAAELEQQIAVAGREQASMAKELQAQAQLGPAGGGVMGRRGVPPTSETWPMQASTSSPSAPSSKRPPAEAVTPQAQLEQHCGLQAQRILELKKELALEEAARANLDMQLQEVAYRMAASGIEAGLDGIDPETFARPAGPDWEECMGLDVDSQLHQIETLRRDLFERQDWSRRVAREEVEAGKVLVSMQQELGPLQEKVDRAKVEAAEIEERTCQARKAGESMLAELQRLEAIKWNKLREVTANKTRCRKLATQVDKSIKLLEHLQELTETLQEQLDLKRAGCFGRPPPWAAPAGSPSPTGRQSPKAMASG